jgi:hypothetical protein
MPPEEQWQHSLSHLAGSAISLRAHWSRLFGNWEKFKPTPEVIELAKQAAHSWGSLFVGKDGKSYPAQSRMPDPVVDQDEDEDEEDGNPDFTDADAYRVAILLRVDSALTMARTAIDAVKNDPAAPAVAKELAKAVRCATEAWSALTDLLDTRAAEAKPR